MMKIVRIPGGKPSSAQLRVLRMMASREDGTIDMTRGRQEAPTNTVASLDMREWARWAFSGGGTMEADRARITETGRRILSAIEEE